MKRKQTPHVSLLHTHLAKIIAGVLATGVIGAGTGVSLNASKSADERTAVLETEVRRIKEDAGQNAIDIKRIDKTTTRIEIMLEMQLHKQGIRIPPKGD